MCPELFNGGKTKVPNIESKVESGDGVLGEGTASPLPPARRSGEHCELS